MREELVLPWDRARPVVGSGCAGAVELRVEGEVFAGLVRLAQECGASVFMVLHAALAGVLSRVGAGSDIVVGSPVAGRFDVALDDLVGCFLNTVVVRSQVSGGVSFFDLVGRVRGRVLEALEHADVPFERVVEAVNPVRSAARHPVFQVMLSLQNNAVGRVGFPGLDVEVLGDGRVESAGFDLLFDVVESEGGLGGRLVFSEDVFDRATAERLARSFERFLAEVVADPSCAVGRVELLSDAERGVLVDWSGGPGGVPSGSVVEWFERRRAECPEAVAVVCGARRLSYRELGERADRLAGALAGRGAGPERVVALAMERSEELVVALLAVLKTGAAYLPLD
ncbi:condensation domain-containing protein, partial [Streptomyces hygroscopicus]|uniref:condensation domain-containing protein n=1 Tax=Streptomyces hygroscopicus TaxID=1912 RepID=UPI0036C839C5